MERGMGQVTHRTGWRTACRALVGKLESSKVDVGWGIILKFI